MKNKPEKSTKKDKYTEQDFLAELEKLSQKMGYKLNVSPELVQQDNGTFSIRIKTEVIPAK